MIVPTTLRIEEELKEDLICIAEKEKRSLNNLINYILEKYVEEEKSKNYNKEVECGVIKKTLLFLLLLNFLIIFYYNDMSYVVKIC